MVGAVLSSLPSSSQVQMLCSLSTTLDLTFHLYKVGIMSTSFLWDSTCNGLVSHPGGVIDYHQFDSRSVVLKKKPKNQEETLLFVPRICSSNGKSEINTV